ncbi:MAG TPA: cupin, partial [Arthrobacter sp.]|nr:cupin [Arthrobacter sp.]
MSVNLVSAMAVKSFDAPDKKRCPDKAEFDLVTVNDYSVARLILGPGWRWSECIKPLEQTDFC